MSQSIEEQIDPLIADYGLVSVLEGLMNICLDKAEFIQPKNETLAAEWSRRAKRIADMLNEEGEPYVVDNLYVRRDI